VIECCAGIVIWCALVAMVVLPGVSGGYLIYAFNNGGTDGLPGSGDAQTDLHIGIFCCVLSAFFLLVCCCMARAVNKAIAVCEAAAACLFNTRSLLLEPIINLTARVGIWCIMLVGFAYLVSVGEVQKSKMYRTFTYSSEEWVFIVFYIVMMLWLNDFCTAMSQYVIANASARWYFTEHSGGVKSVPSCLLCSGYFTGWIFHSGSLALGSLIIALTRPLRIVIMVLLYAGEVTDNGACACVSSACACCMSCFESMLQHICKNAYIDMAITSKGFCAAGSNAAALIKRQTAAVAANAGATWLFTIAGTALVSVSGGFIAHIVVQNVDQFNTPSGQYYIQDPMVCAVLAGIVCFIVALCFMIVFDAVADTLLICLAYDTEEQKQNPVPVWTAPPKPQQSAFTTAFKGGPREFRAPDAVTRPQFSTERVQKLFQ